MKNLFFLLHYMSFQIVTSVDSNTASAQIDFTLNGTLVTSYSYGSDLITLPARVSNSIMNMSQFTKGTEEVDRWIISLKALQPSETIGADFYLTTSYTNNILTYTYETDTSSNPGNKKISMKTEYNFDDKTITFYARNEIQLSYNDFKILHHHSKLFLQQIKFLSRI